MTGRQVVPLTAATTDLLRPSCRGCVRWLRDPVEAHEDSPRHSGPRLRSWAETVTREWGPPGLLVRQDGRTVAHVVVAPPSLVPRAALPATAPVSDDAVLLLSLSSSSRAFTKVAVQSLGRELLRRRVRAVEAYGGSAVVPGCLSPAAVTQSDLPWPPPDVCRVPTTLLTGVGFTVVREHPTCPRLRLDLRSVATVREDVTAAVRSWLSDRATAPAAT